MDFKKYQDKINGISKIYEEKRKDPKSVLKYGQLGGGNKDNSRLPPIEVRPLSKVQDPHQWAPPPKKGDPTAPYRPQFAPPNGAGTPGVPGQHPGQPVAPGYAQPVYGYAPAPGQPAAPGYGQPPAGYAAPPGQQMGQPPQPGSGYSVPGQPAAPGYGQPGAGYAPPPGQPAAPGYGQPVAGYATHTGQPTAPGYGQPAAGYAAPPAQPMGQPGHPGHAGHAGHPGHPHPGHPHPGHPHPGHPHPGHPGQPVHQAVPAQAGPVNPPGAKPSPKPAPEAPVKRPIVDPRTFAPPPSRTAPPQEQKSHISRRPDRTGPSPAVPSPAAHPAAPSPAAPSPAGTPLAERPPPPQRPVPQRPLPTPERPPAYEYSEPATTAPTGDSTAPPTEASAAARPAKPKPAKPKPAKPKPAKPKPDLGRKTSQGPAMPDIGALQSRMAAMGLRADPEAAPAAAPAPVPPARRSAPSPVPAPAPAPAAAPAPAPASMRPAKPKPALKPAAKPAAKLQTPDELELDTLWYTAPMNQLKLPSAFAGRSYSCTGSANSHKENLKVSIRQPNLSVLRISLEWPKSNPHAVQAERHEGYPPRPMTTDELVQQSNRFGDAVAQWSEQQQGRHVGDGECWTLAKEALAASGAMPSQGYVHGAEVLRQNGGSVAYSYDMMRRGDIIQFECAVFAMGSTGPHHTAVVTGTQHSVLQVVEQNVQGSPVQPGRYDLQTMSGGTLVVYRPVSSDWIEPF